MNSTNINRYDVVIVKDDGIGDYFIWNDALRAYKKVFLDKRVLLICSTGVSPLVENDKFFTDVFPINVKQFNKNIRYKIKTILALRKITAEKCIYPCWSGHAVGETAVSCVRAKEKIGMYRCKEDFRKPWHRLVVGISRRKYTQLVRYEESKSELLACEKFTREVIDSDYNYQGGLLRVEPRQGTISQKYCVIALSASENYRVWPPKRFAAIIDEIPEEYNVVLTGYGQDDEMRAEIVLAKVKEKTRVFNLVGKTSLVELTALIQDSSFVIGNDSSAVHMAAATGVPSICIFNGTEYGRFLPYPEKINAYISPRVVNFKMDCYGCQKSCVNIIDGLYACIDKISVEMTIEKLKKLIEDISNKK